MLDEAVTEAIDAIIEFDGHNGFIGAGGKEYTIRVLRQLVADGYRPDPAEVEGYAQTSSGVYHDGARRLRDWYERILAGRYFVDGGRRI